MKLKIVGVNAENINIKSYERYKGKGKEL